MTFVKLLPSLLTCSSGAAEYHNAMCTAYELGKQRGSTPGYLNPKAVAELLLTEETRLIRPTIKAPVIKADGSLATMSWGFRRAFAPKVVRVGGCSGEWNSCSGASFIDRELGIV